MKTFVTALSAIDITDGIVKTFMGQNIIVSSWGDAKNIVKNNFPYLHIHGELVHELDEYSLTNITQLITLN